MSAATDAVHVKAVVKRRGADTKGVAFRGLLVFAVSVSMLVLGVLIYDMIAEGENILTGNLADFLTTGTNTLSIDKAGVWQALKGTLMLSIVVAVVAFPLGIAAGLYLEEYASEGRVARFINVNVRNLAGVPSIVYGLLGFAIFVKALSDEGNQGGLTGGRTVIAGGLTLAALVLPIVIITTQEALRAVPAGIREGSLAIGATQWETTRYHVLPSAAPGILTGTVLSLARAAGEAAPLLVVGALTGYFSTGNQGLWEQVHDGGFTAMPVVIFSYARQPAGQDWPQAVGAASVVLIAMIFLMNGFAIWLRNRYERKW